MDKNGHESFNAASAKCYNFSIREGEGRAVDVQTAPQGQWPLTGLESHSDRWTY